MYHPSPSGPNSHFRHFISFALATSEVRDNDTRVTHLLVLESMKRKANERLMVPAVQIDDCAALEIAHIVRPTLKA